tara:strand:+ start:681 stop:941 length:261 start_codon:yes stop_codon:yes gene_type:complete
MSKKKDGLDELLEKQSSPSVSYISPILWSVSIIVALFFNFDIWFNDEKYFSILLEKGIFPSKAFWLFALGALIVGALKYLSKKYKI